MERKPITIYLDNNHQQKNNLYQKKIILPKKYKQNSNSFKKIKQNINTGQNLIIKQSDNKLKINSYNIKEIKIVNNSIHTNKNIAKIEINFNKNKYNNDKKSINSIISIQKIFRGYIQRKKIKNIKSRIYLDKHLNSHHTKNTMSANNIFDAIKRNSKNQKEIIQLNNNRYNNRNTMSPKNNIKMNMIYKKNLILLKKDISRKKNYSFDYKNKETNIKPDPKINSYKAKNKSITTNLNKNKKNGIKGHSRINSCGNINSNNNIVINNNDNKNKNNKNNKIKPNNNTNIIFNNKNSKNNKSFISSKQTKENSKSNSNNSNTNLTSENKSNLESPKVNIINKNNNNNDKSKILKKENNKLKTESKAKKENEENIINKPYKTEATFEKYNTEEYESEKKPKNFNINKNNMKYNFNPLIKNNDKKKNFFNMNLDMPKFNIFESIKEEKINDNENDTDLKSSFYDDEEFVIINYDYTLNDKKKLLKISKLENISIDGYLQKKRDFIKFIKKGIHTHAIKYVFYFLNNINKKKIEIDKTMTDNGNTSFIQQERIEHNNTIFNKAQFDINNS